MSLAAYTVVFAMAFHVCTNLFDPFDSLVNKLFHFIEEEIETEGGKWCRSDP